MPVVANILPLISGLLMGAALLCLGLCLGIWLGRRMAAVESVNSLKTMYAGLDGVTREVTGGVAQYSKLIEGVDRCVKELHRGEAPLTPNFDEVLLQVGQANQQLFDRLERAEAALAEQSKEINLCLSEARTDSLTGLPNRRVYEEELGRRLAEWRRARVPLSILLIDVDHFKSFNDQHGHQAGDAVLVEVARALRVTMRESALVARFGGEEFAVVLPGSAVDDARSAAERVREAIAELVVVYDEVHMRITVSCGVAQVLDAEPTASLVKRADLALYEAKHAGRNRSYWHDGKLSWPVKPPHPTAPNVAPGASVAPDPRLEKICADLRQRLLDVTAGD